MMGIAGEGAMGAAPTKKPARRAKCVNCLGARRKCDFARPCGQCAHRGVADSCEDVVRMTSCTMCSSLRAKCNKERPCARCIQAGHASLCSSVSDRMAARRPPRESLLGALRSPGEWEAESFDSGETSPRGADLCPQTRRRNFDASGHFEPLPQMSEQDVSSLVAVVDLDRDSRDWGGEQTTEAKLVKGGASEIVEILSRIDSEQVTTHMVSGDGLFTQGRSEFQVPEDMAACLRAMNVEASGAGIDLSRLLSSRSGFVMEVEDSARWIIRAVGQGAARLMNGASHAGTIGLSLTEFVRCEDVIRFRSMWPSDAVDAGAQLPPMHRIWIRCSPRESGLRKRKHSSITRGNGGLEVDWLDELSEDTLSNEQSLYAPVLFYVMQLTRHGRVQLLGSVGTPQNLGRCGMCGMACCESTYDFQDAQVAVRMRHTLRRPEHFQEISGVDLEFQELWTHSAKRDFAWCGVFDRVWNFGYDREQLKRMFTSMPPQLRDATSALTAGVQRLIEMKQRHESNVRLLDQSHDDVPIRDPVALYLSEQSEDLASDPQDSALISTRYDEHGRRRGLARSLRRCARCRGV